MKRTLGLILALTLAGAFAAAGQAAQKGGTMMLVFTLILRRFGALLACMAWARSARQWRRRVSLLRDDQTTAVALEGWALDAERSAEAAARAVAADPAAVRVLRPIVESALHAASKSQTTRRTK
jgi:hypothetical protein